MNRSFGAAAARSAPAADRRKAVLVRRSVAAVLLFDAGAAALMLAGCTEPPITAEHPRIVQRHVLTPYDTYEECLHAKPGERIDYRYEASSAVAFNIHYHDGNSVVMPIVRESSDADAGVFAPRLEEEYCLMWEAGAAGALLDYRIGLRDAAP